MDARAKLLKKIETQNYKPLQKTLDKYNITGVEAKAPPVPRPKRDPEHMKQYSKECYGRHRAEYNQKNILYKIANGYNITKQTLEKWGLPEDLGPLHPMVLQRKKEAKPEN